MTVFLQICDGLAVIAPSISDQSFAASRPGSGEIPFQGRSTCRKGSTRIERKSLMNVPDLIGLIGVAAYLSAYGLLQLGTLKVEDSRYALLNALGALLILYSLIFDFNLASFVTQAAWLVLTAVGYIRSRIKQARTAQS
jgi:hypothetical protein